MENFIECDSKEDANLIDLKKYTFMERMSAQMGKYCFKIRQR